MKRCFFSSIAFLPALWFLAVHGYAGGDKAAPWKVVLPADVYKELTQRSIKNIEETAKSNAADAVEKIAAEAAILRAYTLVAKNPGDDEVATVRGAANLALNAVNAKDVKKLVDFSKLAKSAPKPGASTRLALADVAGLMEIFKKKTSGGDGLHDDLKYQPKLHKLNGIEALIGSLSSKKLTDANAAKVAKELPILAYRIAVVGAMTHEFAPKKDAVKWHEYAGTMRDASIALAEASATKNSAGILKAADMLQNVCTQCHSEFKK